MKTQSTGKRPVGPANQPPAEIYLVPDGRGDYTWCGPPLAGTPKAAKATKYLRSDALGVEGMLAIIANCEAELAKYTM